ncbi:MAG: redoxin domain-containing protein [Gammaproteobacteria bacterium]|nr:redoxin domain-containing protein [Gammaproteobacteria bacterium]
MTQLVELQRIHEQLDDAGYKVFAISNDSVDRLSTFAAQHNVTISLLSDEDSAVIRRFGILNTLIEPHEGRSMKWYGIPFPGTYIVGADGLITDKIFDQHHARRPSGNTLLHRVTGAIPPGDDGNTPLDAAASADSEVTARVRLSDPHLRLEVISTLIIDVQIAAGRHIYGDGAPDEFTPARLTVTGDGIRCDPPHWPAPATLTYQALGINVPVYSENFTITVPITATSSLNRLGHGLERDAVDIQISLTFQSCDDLSCSLPSTLALPTRLPLALLVEPAGLATYAERVRSEAPADQ